MKFAKLMIAPFAMAVLCASAQVGDQGRVAFAQSYCV